MATTDASPIHVPYSDATAREVRITADGCQLHVTRGDGEEWVSGTYQDPSGQRSPEVSVKGGTVTIDHVRTTTNPVAELVAGDPRFDLMLGAAQPYALTLEAAAIEGDVELGALPITRLSIKQRAGRSRLSFDEANPQSAELLQFTTEAAAFEALNLANANADTITVNGDSGTYRLDFGGILQRSTHVKVSTRAASVEIIVPASTSARISSTSPLAELDVDDGFNDHEGESWTPITSGQEEPLLMINASVEVGQLKLRLQT